MTNLYKILAVLIISFLGLMTLSAQTNVGNITTTSTNCDLTIDNCEGDVITLIPQDQTSYKNYKWYFGTVAPANEITAANAATNNVVATDFALNFPTIKVVSGGGIYILTAEFATPDGCATKNDVFTLNFTPRPSATNATLTLCEKVAGGGTADFTLNNADATVTGGTVGVAVTYHASLSDAQKDMTPLSNAYTSGTKTLYARVENTTTGCYRTATLELTVNTQVTPTFTPVSPICSGATLTALPTTSNNGITGTWAPALDNTTTTIYTFTPTAGLCATTTTLTITVNPKPTLTIGTVACQASLTKYDVAFTATGGTVTADKGTVTATQITDIPAGQNVVITVTNVATSCLITQTVNAPNCACATVNAPTKAVGADKTICATETLPTLTASVGAGETIDWYNAATGGTLLLANSTTYTPTAAGTFYAEARNTTSNCVSSTRTTLSLTINPTPSVTKPSNQALCAGATTTAVMFAGAINGTTYNWTSDNATIGLTPTTGSGDLAAFTTVNTGTTAVVATITVTPMLNGCAGTAQTFTITVNPIPTGGTVQVGAITCTNGILNTNGKITISGIVNGAKYSYGTTGTTGLFALNAATLTGGTIMVSNLASPASATTYTFRIYGADTTCYKDITAVLNPTVCSPCNIAATFTQGVCNNNGTTAISADDYFTVTVSGVSATNGGTSGKYEVILNGNVLNIGGTAYGTSVTVGGILYFKSDGATTYSLTVRDLDNPSCTTTAFTTTASANCSNINCKPMICLPVTITKF